MYVILLLENGIEILQQLCEFKNVVITPLEEDVDVVVCLSDDMLQLFNRRGTLAQLYIFKLIFYPLNVVSHGALLIASVAHVVVVVVVVVCLFVAFAFMQVWPIDRPVKNKFI